MKKQNLNLKKIKVNNDCYKKYVEGGYSAVIEHVELQQSLGNPDYEKVVYEHCEACDNEMPSLDHICLCCGQTTTYFHIVSKGFNKELLREEIQIHAGLNGNIFIIKTEEGFIVDVYGQEIHLNSMTVWEDDLENCVNLFGDDVFSYTEVDDFINDYGVTIDELNEELGLGGDVVDELAVTEYFCYAEKWIPIKSVNYSQREQSIADYLRLSKY